MIEVLVIGFILSFDSFTVALAMGSRPHSKKDALLFAFTSGSAEALVTLIGVFGFGQMLSQFEAIDHWMAFGLLMMVAIHMAVEGIRELKSKKVVLNNDKKLVFHSFTKVLIASLATSLDAFGVGVALGISEKPLIPYIISIGAWAFIATLFGLQLAKKLSQKFGSVMSLMGAVVLGLIACQMLSI